MKRSLKPGTLAGSLKMKYKTANLVRNKNIIKLMNDDFSLSQAARVIGCSRDVVAGVWRRWKKQND